MGGEILIGIWIFAAPGSQFYVAWSLIIGYSRHGFPCGPGTSISGYVKSISGKAHSTGEPGHPAEEPGHPAEEPGYPAQGPGPVSVQIAVARILP